jgi:hypothetical protein
VRISWHPSGPRIDTVTTVIREVAVELEAYTCSNAPEFNNEESVLGYTSTSRGETGLLIINRVWLRDGRAIRRRAGSSVPATVIQQRDLPRNADPMSEIMVSSYGQPVLCQSKKEAGGLIDVGASLGGSDTLGRERVRFTSLKATLLWGNRQCSKARSPHW